MNLRQLVLPTCRIGLTVLLTTVSLAVFTPTGALAAEVNLVIDGQRIEYSPPPVIIDGRTLVPVRVISEKLGAAVGWDQQTRTVTVTLGARWLKLRIGNRLVDLRSDDLAFSLTDVPPFISNNRTFIPLRLVATALGVSVQWDAATKTVLIDSNATASPALQSPATLASIQPNQVINGPRDLQIALAGELPVRAAEVRFLLLDPETGRGPTVARGNTLTGLYRLLPDPAYNGRRLLASAIYDQKGQFITGDVIPIELAVAPQVSLAGLSAGQTVEGAVSLATSLNFLATHIRYELIDPKTGAASEISKADPQAQFSWAPHLGNNGERIIRAVAYDRLGQAHFSPQVPITVAVKHRLTLTGVSAGTTIEDKPVTLGLSLNFPAREVQYILKEQDSGSEDVLAQLNGSAGYRWLPTPAQNGRRQLLAEVTDNSGNKYRSAPIPLEVRSSPWLFLETVGPNQVLAGTVQLQSLSNVALSRIEYHLIDPKTGVRRTIASGTEPQAKYSWTPGPNDAGSWQINVLGITPTGEKITNKPLPVRVHTGELHGPMPVIEKNRFLEFSADLARRSAAQTGMSAALQAAQAILETGWGQFSPVDKYTGQPSNNLFGIKGTGPAGSVISNTWEEYNGVTFRIDAPFRAYFNLDESWNDHKRLLLTAPRYEPFRAVMYDSTRGAWALKQAGYATDSQYPLKLIELIKSYKLDRLDEVGV